MRPRKLRAVRELMLLAVDERAIRTELFAEMPPRDQIKADGEMNYILGGVIQSWQRASQSTGSINESFAMSSDQTEQQVRIESEDTRRSTDDDDEREFSSTGSASELMEEEGFNMVIIQMHATGV